MYVCSDVFSADFDFGGLHSKLLTLFLFCICIFIFCIVNNIFQAMFNCQKICSYFMSLITFVFTLGKQVSFEPVYQHSLRFQTEEKSVQNVSIRYYRLVFSFVLFRKNCLACLARKMGVCVCVYTICIMVTPLVCQKCVRVTCVCMVVSREVSLSIVGTRFRGREIVWPHPVV